MHHPELEQQVDGDRRTHSVLIISMLLEILTEDVVFRGWKSIILFLLLVMKRFSVTLTLNLTPVFSTDK